MSRTANTVRRTLLGDGTDDAGCALKLMRREVLPSLIPLRTLYSFIPACAAADGWRIRPVPVAHRPRTGGRSHYGLVVMMWQPLLDMLALWWILRRRLPRPHRPAPGQEGRDA
jgi:dolichol-phosphate mannosyltransferase